MTKGLIKNKQKKGFTLVEMMIVVAIIAVLAGVAIPQYNKYVKKSETTEAMRFMKQITDAEILYYSTHKLYVDIDTADATDTGAAQIGFTAPTGADFKYYEVKACGTNGIVIKASTSNAYDSEKTVYSYYPAGLTLKAVSDKNFYTGNMYLQDYIDEKTTASAVRPQCP